MTRLTLRGIATRRLRTALTAVAIVLGVAMVTGSFVLTDTIGKAFDAIFASAYRDTDAVVRPERLVGASAGGATLGEEVLDQVRAHPDVEAATGSIVDLAGSATTARLLGRDGTTLGGDGNPTFGFGVDPAQPRFNPLELVDGRWARGGDEVVIDGESAASGGFAVGDRIRISANGPTRSYRISGIAGFGGVRTIGGATIAAWDVETARRALRLDGYTTLSVAAREGVSDEALVRSLRAVLDDRIEVTTGAEQAAADSDGVATFVTFLRGALLGFGAVALLVGAFVIFNSLSITVAQRTRELATLRMLGASRGQIRRGVVVEAAVLGLASSAVGIAAGVGLARGLGSLFGALGLSLPEADPVYAARTFALALAVGVGVTVAAGLAPAVRATRVAPIAAVRDGAPPTGRGRAGTVVGVLLLAVSGLLLVRAFLVGSIGQSGALLALLGGTLALVAGAALVASRLVTSLVTLVGLPARALGGPAGRLGARNAVRAPGRTAATAAALMIALTLVTFLSVLAAGVRDSYAEAVRGQLRADWVVTSSDGWTPFPTDVGEAVAGAFGVESATSIRGDRGLVGDLEVNVNAVDPATLDGLYRFAWRDGSDDVLRRLGAGGAIVKAAFAKDAGLAPGDRFTLRTPAGTPIRLEVVGTYQPPRVGELLGGVILSQETFDRSFPRPQNAVTLVRGGSPESLRRSLAAFPATTLQTDEAYVDAQVSFIGSALGLLYVLLGLSVVVSVLGMVNTLVLSVLERTREIGMLRAVGMSRSQARRMVRHESVITALIGAALGLPLGLLLAAGLIHSLGPYGVAFTLPVASFVVLVVAALVCGVVAAVAPARRAARLDVLRALQLE